MGKRWCEFKAQLTGDVCCQCIHITQHYINFHPTFTLLPLEVWRYRHSGFEVYQETKQENNPFLLPVPSFYHFVHVDQHTHPKSGQQQLLLLIISSLPNRSLLVKWVSELLKGKHFALKGLPITYTCNHGMPQPSARRLKLSLNVHQVGAFHDYILKGHMNERTWFYKMLKLLFRGSGRGVRFSGLGEVDRYIGTRWMNVPSAGILETVARNSTIHVLTYCIRPKNMDCQNSNLI